MAESTNDQRLTRMRRADKAADESWIRAFLHRAPFGVLAPAEG